MKFSNIVNIALITFAPLLGQASSLQCIDLFAKTYKAKEFVIEIQGKKQQQRFLETAHDSLLTNDEPAQIKAILEVVSKQGLDAISAEQREFIIAFRQNSSALRSMFQTSAKGHTSPENFANFVRDFGILKDYLLMGEAEKAQLIATKILKKHGDLDFNKILSTAEPASKKSVAKHFTKIIEITKKIMEKPELTIDEVHDVRKNLRDVLRYLQMEKEILTSNQQLISESKSEAISFLKKLNTKLGLVCDDYAAAILRDKGLKTVDKITKHTLVDFPEDLRPRIEYFLTHIRIEIPE